MKYVRSEKYNTPALQARIMGPNPVKLEEELLDFLVPQYISEGKAQLVISVGCTGGQHRSVFIANKLYEFLRERGYSVEITHRDIPKKV